MAFEQQLIDIGALPNDGTGDPLRVAYDKINQNFTGLFSTVTNTDTQTTNLVGQPEPIITVPVTAIDTGEFLIYTTDTVTGDTQFARASVQVTNSGTGVSYTVTGATWSNLPLVTYDAEVVSGNVVINIESFVANPLSHFIGSQVLFNGV